MPNNPKPATPTPPEPKPPPEPLQPNPPPIPPMRPLCAIDDSCTRLRSALSDCTGTIIYSRRRKVFLETHWVAPTSCRVSYRVVADLGVTAMGCLEACGGGSQEKSG